MQNDKGRKKTLTNVRSLIFSPKRVDARLSITPLALNNWELLAVASSGRFQGWL